MTVPCLSTPKSERHNVQNIGVQQIEETLEEHKRKLIEAVAAAQNTLNDLEGSKSMLMQALDDAKASLEEKKATFLAAHAAREEAKTAAKESGKAVAGARAASEKGEANYAALQKEKADIETVYQEHYKAPMEGNEGPHYSSLKPFVEKLGLEDSLTSALPASCVKTKEQRGGFDDLVLTELGKALVGKIAGLEKSITEEEAAVADRKAAVVVAEAVHETKQETEQAAIADLEASTAQHDAEAVVKKASEDWSSFEPRMQQATDDHNLQDTKRIDFMEGAFKDFVSLRDKEAVEEEAAVAGA